MTIWYRWRCILCCFDYLICVVTFNSFYEFITGLTLYDKSYELNWEVPEKLSCPNKSFTMTGSK